MVLPRTAPGRALLGVRLVLGTTSWGAPRAVMSAIGMAPDENPQAAYMARLFGVRDVTLGLGLMASRGEARRLWWRLGMLCDLGDAAAGALCWRRGELPPGRGNLVLFTGAGLVGAGLGAAALARGDV